MDTKEVIARFESERQALAMMEHPNIAKVLDGGATETGRPFFVMELVRGIPITHYSNDNRLNTAQRLELFILVCQAIQHAHQKGIIHRDIKPSNILVADHDGIPVPKVIDFGIAKATSGQALTNRTLFTAFEQFIGTPAYMSPEQAKLSGLDIDTRSDIYSLGVLLYELLTGKTPFDSKRLLQAGIEEVCRIIREEEPPRPSTRLSTLAAAEQTTLARQRHSEPPKLIHLVKGDLDWIVMRALEKDRNRRYETANALAMDLRRHLSNEPVVARPASAWYRLRKLIRRNKIITASAGAIAISLVIGAGVSIRFYLTERAERRRAQTSQHEAERQAKIAKQTTDFLTGMFESIDPAVAKLKEITVREVLDKAALNIGTNFPNEPMTELPIQRTIIDVYQKLGRSDLAMTHAEAELSLARTVYGKEDRIEIARALEDVAACRFRAGQLELALEKYEEAQNIYERMYKVDHPRLAAGLNNVAVCLDSLARPSEGLAKHQASLAMRKRLYKGDDPEVAVSLNSLGACLGDLGRWPEALTQHEAALAMRQRIYKGDHPDVARDLNNVGFSLDSMGRSAEALPKYEAALEMRQRIYGGDHPDVAISLNNIAGCLDSLGRSAEALSRYEQALSMRQRMYKSDHPVLAKALHNVAFCLDRMGRSAEALPKFQLALEIWQRLHKTDHPEVANGFNGLACCMDHLGRYSEALPKHESALAIWRKVHPLDHPDVATGLKNQADCLLNLGKMTEADQAYNEAKEMLQ